MSPRTYRRLWSAIESLEKRLLLAAGTDDADAIIGDITIPGERDTYTFSLATRGRYYFDSLTANGGMNWTLSGPRGTLVGGRPFASTDAHDFAQPVFEVDAGDYTLVIDGSGDTTGPYSFRLVDLASAVAIALGTPVSGELSPTRATDLYQFSGTAGQRLYFDALSASGFNNANPVVMLVDPYGNQVFRTSWADVEPFTLPASGTYYLLVEGRVYNTTDTGQYSFNLVPVADAQTTISVGDEVAGTISNPGQQVRYSFTLPAEAILYFDSLTPNADLRWFLSGPAGLVVNARPLTGSDSYDISYPFLKLIAGQYTLTVDGNGDATGDYAFRLLDVASAVAMTPGTVVSGTLSPQRETDFYGFDANAGDLFAFTAISASGFTNANPVALLIDPYGNVLFRVGWGNVSTFTLTRTGRYTLLIEGRVFNSTGSGSYSFNLEPQGSVAIPPVTGTPLIPGATTSGAIDAPGEEDIYTFTLATRVRGYMDALSLAVNLAWSLEGPAGLLVNNRDFLQTDSHDNVYPILDLIPGDYALRVFGRSGATGAYSFRAVDLATANPLTAGTAVSGDLTPARETDFYQFSGTAGQRLYFDSGPAIGFDNTTPVALLIAPAGNVIFRVGWSDVDTFELPASGTYHLLIEGRIYNNAATGSYSFNLVPVVDGQTGIAVGDEVSGSISVPGQRNRYSFTLGAESQLYVDSLTLNGSLRWSLAGPAGTAVNGRSFAATDSYDNDYPLLRLVGGNTR